MACLIKNVPRNAKIAPGNRGKMFPSKRSDCYFIRPQPDCYLGLQEARSVGVLQEDNHRILLHCPVRIQDCYVSMQEDGFTPLLLEDNVTYFGLLSC